jgi:predicted phosphate transport protein (TIGR00153 family)
MVLDHLKVAADAVYELKPLLDSLRAGDGDGVRKATHVISELERLADNIHRDAVVKIARGAFFSGTKEDFLRLMEADDEIVDHVKDATRVLTEAPLPAGTAEILFGEINRAVPDMLSRIVAAIEALADAIRALETDAKDAVDRAIAVEIAEEEADDIKERLLGRIIERRGILDPLVVLQLRDFVLQLDNIADSAEDASDIVVELVAKAEA